MYAQCCLPSNSGVPGEMHAGWPNVCAHDYSFLGHPESYCEKYRVLSQLWEGGEVK